MLYFFHNYLCLTLKSNIVLQQFRKPAQPKMLLVFGVYWCTIAKRENTSFPFYTT